MIRLHHCHQTRSMRTLWLLHELDIPFEVSVYPFDETLRGEAFAALNPLGRVPVLEIDGAVMTETGAMTEFLCERFPDLGYGRGPDDPDRMEWLTWVHFAETLSQHTAALTQQHIVLYEDAMRSPVIMKLEAKRLAKGLQIIEDALSTPIENRDYLLTSGFSAADISVGQAVYMAQHFVRLEAFEEVSNWFDRITERPSFQAALPPPDNGERLYAEPFYPVWEG